MNNLNIQRRESSGNKTIEERRWELLKGVRKSLEELNIKDPNNETIIRFIYFRNKKV